MKGGHNGRENRGSGSDSDNGNFDQMCCFTRFGMWNPRKTSQGTNSVQNWFRLFHVIILALTNESNWISSPYSSFHKKQNLMPIDHLNGNNIVPFIHRNYSQMNNFVKYFDDYENKKKSISVTQDCSTPLFLLLYLPCLLFTVTFIIVISMIPSIFPKISTSGWAGRRLALFLLRLRCQEDHTVLHV